MMYNFTATDSGPYQRVKIAILDTGIALAKISGRPDIVDNHVQRIKECEAFGGLDRGDIDEDGHGTHAAMLLHRVCPNADIYVARVTKSTAGIRKEPVIDALEWAVGKPVDIINMSLGWHQWDTDMLEQALKKASEKNILLFAATSNDGLRLSPGMAYPAIAANVFGIDAAFGRGKASDSNPASNDENNRKWRFTAPGESVLSAYPTTIEPNGLKRLSGTSVASPIAAGLAALVLEFARQPPLSFEPDIALKLKRLDGMQQVFRTLLSEKQDDGQPHKFLLPWKTFKSMHLTDGTLFAGDEWTSGKPRRKAAEAIADALSEIFSGLGDKMYAELNRIRGGLK